MIKPNCELMLGISSMIMSIWHCTYKRGRMNNADPRAPWTIICFVPLANMDPYCFDYDDIYTLSYYHHQIGSMNYYPLLRVRSWNNGVRCMSFFILIIIYTHIYIYRSRRQLLLRFLKCLVFLTSIEWLWYFYFCFIFPITPIWLDLIKKFNQI